MEIKIKCAECGDMLETKTVREYCGDIIVEVEPCQCVAKDDEIKQYRNEVRDLEDQVEELESDIEDKDKEIEKLKEQIDEISKANEALSNAITK